MRLIARLDADGATQMAFDEALLERAATTTLRLYGWRPATVSLGYFQDHATIAAQLPSTMPVVRRITGGGAIWHEHEITYALVGRLGHDGMPASPRALYRILHGAILARLARASLALQGSTVGDRRYRDEPRCFASPAADDVVACGGGKVLGSLKLATNPWDGPAVAGCGLDAATAAAALIAGVADALGRAPAPGDATTDERAATARIRAQRYGDASWVRERRGPRP